jgi:hypothetical protein
VSVKFIRNSSGRQIIHPQSFVSSPHESKTPLSHLRKDRLLPPCQAPTTTCYLFSPVCGGSNDTAN